MIIDTFGRNAVRTRSYLCPICDCKVKTPRLLRQHMAAQHPRKPGTLDPSARAWIASRSKKIKVTLAGSKKEEP